MGLSLRVKIETAVCVAVLSIFGWLLLYAVLVTRAEIRDDQRKQDLTTLKQALEQYNNRHHGYPAAPPNQSPCTTSDEKDSWFFSEASSKGYRYCAAAGQQGLADGFFLETALEHTQPTGTFKDEDERRKFRYRVLEEDGKLLYRICGGTEDQCGYD